MQDHRSHIGCVCALIAGLVVSPAFADQPQVDPAVARAQQLLKQVAAEKQKLEAQVLQLQDDLAKADVEHKKALSELKDENASTKATLQEAQTALTDAQKSNLDLQGKLHGTEATLSKTRGGLSDMTQKNADTEAKLAQTIAERDAMKAQLEGKLADETKLRKDAETKNQKLYDYNVELMHIYAAKTCSDSLLQREPFTGIKQVEVENILEEYSYKLDQQKVDTQIPTPAPASVKQ